MGRGKRKRQIRRRERWRGREEIDLLFFTTQRTALV
jgi:hypothetical protein